MDNRFGDIETFLMVAGEGSLAAAAKALRLTPSAVSRSIARLEQRLGVTLLRRTTRALALTPEGVAYRDRMAVLLGDMMALEAGLGEDRTAPRGLLRINASPSFGIECLIPILPGFRALYPAVTVDLTLSDTIVDLVEERADIAIRIGPLRDTSLRAKKLGHSAMVLVASPAYLARYGMPQTPADLENHQVVRYASPTSERVAPWEWMEQDKRQVLDLPGRVTVNNAEAYIACCLSGLGLIQIPAYDVQAHLQAGELVEVLPDHRAAPMPMSLLYLHRQHLSRRFQVFADWLETLLHHSAL